MKNKVSFFGPVRCKEDREKHVGKLVKNLFKWGEADSVKRIKAGDNRMTVYILWHIHEFNDY